MTLSSLSVAPAQPGPSHLGDVPPFGLWNSLQLGSLEYVWVFWEAQGSYLFQQAAQQFKPSSVLFQSPPSSPSPDLTVLV